MVLGRQASPRPICAERLVGDVITGEHVYWNKGTRGVVSSSESASPSSEWQVGRLRFLDSSSCGGKRRRESSQSRGGGVQGRVDMELTAVKLVSVRGDMTKMWWWWCDVVCF